ncbi:MAG: TIGR03618 family F420-dependent PPOX class oxidoreductase [Lapillicoccus sp.]
MPPTSPRLDPRHLPDEAVTFLTERHLATMTTLRPDGSPHVVAIAFTYDPETATARVITNGTSRKVRNLLSGGPVVLCQVEGRQWLSLEGRAVVDRDPAAVADAVARYAVRYRQPGVNPERVVVVIDVTRIMGHL